MVKDSVKKWEHAVKSELARKGIPIPSDIVLAVMWVESRGKAGLTNKSSGASGLLQVMPGTLMDFNQRHGKNYTIDEMRGESTEDALKQIEVGIAVLAHYWRSASRYLQKKMSTVPVDLLAHVADLFYAAGPGATQKRLNKLSSITWDSIQEKYPEWAAIPHPRNVFEKVLGSNQQYPIEQIQTWLGTSVQGETEENPQMGFLIGVLLLMAANWLMKGK